MWESDLLMLCMKNDICPVVGPKGEYLLVVSKMPPEEIKQRIREMVPQEIQYEYLEGPKPTTTEGLKMLLKQLGVTAATMEMKERVMIINITSDNPALTEDSNVWKVIRNLLTSDTYLDGFKVTINDQLMLGYDRQIAKAITTRKVKDRDVGFTPDDIMNLRIELENCRDSQTFIDSL